MRTFLELPAAMREELWAHLLSDAKAEQAGFVFARANVERGDQIFRAVEWVPVPSEGFAARTGFFFELTDEMRAAVIKRAHDLDTSLVEFHSHVGPWPATFSGSDWSGFEEFVPHVWWRLKGRPYLAVVVARNTFDGLVWIDGPTSPQRLDGILVGESIHAPTGHSRLEAGLCDD